MIDDLYSARILTLAANMPRTGRLAAPQGSGHRVAKLCGSTATVDVILDDAGRVADYPARHASTLVAVEAALDAVRGAERARLSGAA